MKRTIVIFAISLVCVCCHAQGFIDHIVQRGETLEFLATKFGVSIQDILEQNEDLDLDVLYVGLPLQIPIPELDDSSEDLERFIAAKSSANSYLDEANTLFANGSYKKAAKLYSTAIKDNPSSDLYFLRGRCYLFLGKYKSAIKDLELANNGIDLSFTLKNTCRELLADAQNKREAQLEARSEAWGRVFEVAAIATAVVLDAATTSSQSSYAPSTSYNSSSTSTVTSTPSTSSTTSTSSASSTTTRQCPSCQNTKHCSQCRGTGFQTDNMLGTGQDPTKKCGICGGSGVCPKCKGTGRI